MSLSIFVMINILKAHPSGKLKSEISWRLTWFSFKTGVGMNFKPRESKLICFVYPGKWENSRKLNGVLPIDFSELYTLYQNSKKCNT